MLGAPTLLTYHDSSRNCVPFQPERDEGRSDQDDARYKHRGEVESPVSGEYQVHFQTAVVTCQQTQNQLTIIIIASEEVAVEVIMMKLRVVLQQGTAMGIAGGIVKVIL